MGKKELRVQLLRKRMSIPKQIERDLSQKICNSFVNYFTQTIEVIGIYMPIKNEVDPRFIVDKVQLKFASPVINGNKIQFKPYFGDESCVKNQKFGMLEPEASLSNIMPDIVIVPMLGFDINCNRIGYGRGFYDRFFSQNKRIVKVGFAFGLQKCDHIFPEAHDIVLDYIITENEIISH